MQTDKIADKLSEKPIVENLLSRLEFTEGEISSRILYKSDNFSCALLCLGQGAGIDTHESSGKTSLQVLRGSGKIIIDGRETSLNEGTFIYFPEHTPHAIKSEGNLAVLLYLGHLLTREMYDLKHY